MLANINRTTLFSGLVFITALAAVIILIVTRPSARFEKIMAVITAVETADGADADGADTKTYTYYVDYTFKNVEYSHIVLDYSEPGYKVGKELEIYCDPDDPAKIKSDSKTMLIYVSAVAAVSLLVFIFSLISGRTINRSSNNS